MEVAKPIPKEEKKEEEKKKKEEEKNEEEKKEEDPMIMKLKILAEFYPSKCLLLALLQITTNH
jgi:hypothetical protein